MSKNKTDASCRENATEASTPRFKSLQDLAEDHLKRKLPKHNWKDKEEKIGNLERAISRVMDIEWRVQFPKVRYDTSEAMKRAKAGSLDDLWRLLVCFGMDLLAKWPFVLERYRLAFAERDWNFMLMFWNAAGFHYSRFNLEGAVGPRRKVVKCPEPRPRLVGWLSFNPEMLRTMTAAELLKKWDKHRRENRISEDGFPGDHGEQNFRRWLTQHGIKLGHKNRPRKI